MKPLCIYHGNCADGFGAAWVFKNYADRDFDFHPGVYQDAPPDVTGRDVYLVDFSYKRDVVVRMREQCSRLVLIDHHKTALDDLRGLIDSRAIESLCSLDHSGAMLAMRWFCGDNDTEVPQLLRHIEDRDLWRFALPFTREIQANLFSYPYDFTVWDELMRTPLELLIEGGKAIERKHHKDIAELCSVMARPCVIGGVPVLAANLPYTLTSDAGHRMAVGNGTDASPQYAFAACYWDTFAGRVFSLRSASGGYDVSEIAKKYGGGGHKNAAGFRVPHGHALTNEAFVNLAAGEKP